MAIRDFFKSKQKSDKQIDETTPYYRIGGEEKVRELANRFYDVMENDTYAAELLSIHPQPLDRIRHVFFLYLSLWLGGPDIYQQEFGHPRLRAPSTFYCVASIKRTMDVLHAQSNDDNSK